MQIMVSFISATTINSWAEANPRRAQEILPEFDLYWQHRLKLKILISL